MSNCGPEQALLDSAIAGDTTALERLFFTYFSALERHIEPQIPRNARRQFGVDDILQEVFYQAFRDIGQCASATPSSFYAWLKAIADHRLTDAVKRIGRKKRGGDYQQLSISGVAKASTMATLIDFVCHDSHLPDQSAARREAEKLIQVAVSMLPEDQRTVIRAHFFDHMSVAEIAQQTGRTSAAVRGLIYRGKVRLAEAMGRSSRWLNRR
jgi:RNA polymerase sigma-70 factor (subfamily 1)